MTNWDMPSALIVETDASTCEILRRSLAAERYTVMHATSGEEVSNLLHDVQQPVVVILNYELPNNDAWRVLWLALDDPALSERCGFILMTRQPKKLLPVFHLALKRLSLQVLIKPFTVEQAQVTIQYASRRLRQRLERSYALTSHEGPARQL